MNTKLPPLRDALRRQLSATRLRDWLPSRGNLLFTLLVAFCLIGATTSGVLAAPQSRAAQAGTSTGTIAYQGRLADASGAALTGAYIIVFRLYDVASGGSSLWEESWTGTNSVQVTNGLFNVMLGSLTPIPQSLLNGNGSLWLGIDVGSDAEMTPRVQLGSAPYAFQSQHANLADLANESQHASLADRAKGLSAPDGDPADAVIVDNDGKIGIGTTNPTAKLQIGGQGGLLSLWNNDSATVSTSYVDFQVGITNKPEGTANNWIDIMSFGDGYPGIISTGGGDSLPQSRTDLIFADGEAMMFANYYNKPFYFIQNAGSSYYGPSYIPLTIGGNGNVGIGTGAGNPSSILTVGQYRGNILADGYSVYSSGRWKENIAPIGDALSIVQQLRGVTFDWKESGKHDLGLIAEEVGKVLPQVVTYEANGQDARGVDYSRLVAVLIQATNEQQATISTQQQQIAALDARLAALERSGGKPADPAVGLFSAWDVAVILAMAGGLIVFWRHAQKRGVKNENI
jgi:hypothetical protein